jgi:hypothetical protein
MTQREFFLAVAALDNIPQNLADYATAQAQKVADKNSARNAKVKAKKDTINAPILAQIREILADGNAHTCAEIAAYTGANPPKIAALVKPLIDGGTVVKDSVKVGDKKAVAYKNA